VPNTLYDGEHSPLDIADKLDSIEALLDETRCHIHVECKQSDLEELGFKMPFD
jgi:hypothetical protein